MYGGSVTVPSYSPHLRKSGSRPVFIDPSRRQFRIWFYDHFIGVVICIYSFCLLLNGSSTSGSNEGGSSTEEGFPLLTESDEMKGSSTPLSAATIVPSPVLLWRFKVLYSCNLLFILFVLYSLVKMWIVTSMIISSFILTGETQSLIALLIICLFLHFLPLVLLFIIWGFICCKTGWDSVTRIGEKWDLFLYEAFLYYNPLLLVNLMVWLWGVNLWVFSNSTISYSKVFDLDQYHLTHNEIWKCATWMTIVVPTSMTAYLYLYSHGEVSLAASQPVLLYAASVMILISPFDIFFLPSRYFLLRTLWRIVLPLQAITFPDFFLADIMTSMSKVFSDMERSVCRMVHRQVATIAWFEADSVCGSHSAAIPIVLVLPYIFRLFQCLRQYKDTRERASVFNALKYSTAVPVIFLSALKYHVFPDNWTNVYRPLWLLSGVINSMYSFYWDVTRDWDLSVLSRVFKFNKPSLFSYIFHGRKWVFFWVLSSNLILRCTWTYKLSAHLRHNHITVFTITALEIYRRFQWAFFRVENEWNKMTNKSNLPIVSMNEIPSEETQLLGSNSNHNI